MKLRQFLIFLLFAAALLAVEGSQEAFAQRNRVEVSSLSTLKEGRVYAVHKCKRKESLEDIADAYMVSQQAIRKANPHLNFSKKIKKGTTILIPLFDEEEELQSALEDSLLQDTIVVDTLPREVLFGLTAPIDRYEPLHVTLLLPFGTYRSTQPFVEFYNGVLLALDELEERGARVELNVISTDKSVERTEEIIASGDLDSTNLIIGPIYSNEYEVISEYASMHRIPVVSPLAGIGEINAPFAIGVAPIETTKWDGFKSKLSDAQNNVVFIRHTTKSDNDMLNNLLPFSPLAKQISYVDKNTNISEISNMLTTKNKNIVVVPINDEIAVEEILSRLSSLNAMGRYDIEVIGNSSWARFNKLNMDLLFKLEVNIPSSYFYDYLDIAVSAVHSRYITNYSGEPSLYAMRGYDVGMIFIGGLFEFGDELMYKLRGNEFKPLQTNYNFEQTGSNGALTNNHWAIVHYQPNYSITVE